jgi:hypothetical protein
MRTIRLVVLLGLAISAGACTLGPRNIQPDRFDYNEAIARSNQEQLLSNIVRLRYSEPPVFLGVGSVLTQYVYSGRIGVNGAAAADSSSIPGWTVGGSATGAYLERPTITYSPLVGQDFAQQLLAPIDAAAVFALIQSGWSPRELLMLTLESINGVEGSLIRPVPTRADLDQVRAFCRIVDLLLAVASRDAIEMHRDADNPSLRFLVFAEDTDAETSALIAELKDALDLDRNRSRFRVTDRSIRKPDEITMRVRSFGAMLGLESRGVDVPAEHIDAQRAIPMTSPKEDPDVASLIRLRVRSQAERPDDAFVAIRYGGYWYFVPNNDHQSKQTFGLLGYLFQIQAPAAQSVGGPVLTVPTG